ncbi:MAG: LysM peptidoglycan-binding domain-containing protein, partial [Bacteroidales bacterium]|nr:LysM peptidoglycan-binding domain-containing protein [Bacteroidales bacterium]
AQVPVEVSNEKMIYGGKIFFMHDVQKGQTLYSISRAYKVTIDAITRENVIPASGIQAGQVLRIPSVADNSEIPAQPRPAAQPAQRSAPVASPAPSSSPAFDPATGIRLARERIIFNGKPYYMHEVLKGQTLYSLARAYKVTILDIDRENAIPAGGIRAGQVLRIPVSSSLVAQEDVVPQDVTVQERPAASTTQSRTAVPAAGTSRPADAGTAKVKETSAGIKSQPDPKLQTKEAAPADAPARQTAATTQTTSSTRQTEATNQTPAPVREPEAKPAPPAKKKIHKVQKGESLADIAKKYDLTVQELKQANKGVIFAMPDMRLVIPVKGDQEQDN